jgi:preprotein translocase subunit SecA
MGLSRWLKRSFGSHSSRELARGETVLEQVEEQGGPLRGLSEEELTARASHLRKKVREAGERGRGPEGDGFADKRLERFVPEAFSLVREVAARKVGMRHFDVQVLGGYALYRGNVVEMKTGEGKTLAATLPVVLFGLSGQGVHVVTVNDYLAARDAEWMGPIYDFFGLSVGVVTEDMDPETHRAERRAAYRADVTYVTNHELVFDYLRDSMAHSEEEIVLRGLSVALVDEVDLLLLDEARTPLIISESSEEGEGLSFPASRVVERLREGRDYRVDHRTRQASLTEKGLDTVESALGLKNLADPENRKWQHAVRNALLAHAVYERDVDYIVDREGEEVLLIDEHTGRVSPDKRMADGLHQALEAKEGVMVRSEDVTVAKITYQSFFRMYPFLCGMTGTAASARAELRSTYGLDVVVVPTNEPMIREDLPPRVYRSGKEKLEAVADEVSELEEAGRPVLVGTTSVRESERLSRVLERNGIAHSVLNAKNHRAEGAVIAQAGRSGAVTISTNMAGRGVDIMLGGAPKGEAGSDGKERKSEREARLADRERVVAAGGLAVLGTGRHESRRIDDQLRGRAGRQGDPGTSQFFLSPDDPVYKSFGEMEISGANQVLAEMRARLKSHPRGEPVGDRTVLETLESLRLKVEEENKAVRRDVFRYDQVIDDQRRRIQKWRRAILGFDGEAMRREMDSLLSELAEDLVYVSFDGDDEERLDVEDREGFLQAIEETFSIELGSAGVGNGDVDASWDDDEEWVPEESAEEAVRLVRRKVERLEKKMGADEVTARMRHILLSAIDEHWTEYLGDLEEMDEGIGLRGYAELDPLVEFTREAKLMFEDVMRHIRIEALSELCSS